MMTAIMISDNDKTWRFENLISREIICLTPIAIGACQHGNSQNPPRSRINTIQYSLELGLISPRGVNYNTQAIIVAAESSYT